METRFTPRPWTHHKGSTPHFQGQIYAETGRGETIAITYNDESDANAALIAAAPELYAEHVETERILVNLIEDLEPIAGGPVITGLVKRLAAIRAALAKARGET